MSHDIIDTKYELNKENIYSLDIEELKKITLDLIDENKNLRRIIHQIMGCLKDFKENNDDEIVRNVTNMKKERNEEKETRETRDPIKKTKSNAKSDEDMVKNEGRNKIDSRPPPESSNDDSRDYPKPTNIKREMKCDCPKQREEKEKNTYQIVDVCERNKIVEEYMKKVHGQQNYLNGFCDSDEPQIDNDVIYAKRLNEKDQTRTLIVGDTGGKYSRDDLAKCTFSDIDEIRSVSNINDCIAFLRKKAPSDYYVKILIFLSPISSSDLEEEDFIDKCSNDLNSLMKTIRHYNYRGKVISRIPRTSIISGLKKKVENVTFVKRLSDIKRETWKE